MNLYSMDVKYFALSEVGGGYEIEGSSVAQVRFRNTGREDLLVPFPIRNTRNPRTAL